MKHKEVVVYILAKVAVHVATLVAKKLSGTCQARVICFEPDRFSHIKIDVDYPVNAIDLSAEAYKNKRVLILALEASNTWLSIHSFSNYLKTLNVEHAGIMCFMDIPEFDPNKDSLGYNLGPIWKHILAEASRWHVAINDRPITEQLLMKYLSKKPLFKFNWPLLFQEPKKLYGRNVFMKHGMPDDEYAIYCANIMPQKGQHKLIEMISKVPGLSLKMVGSTLFDPDYMDKCRKIVKDTKSSVKIYSYISEQEKYDLIGGSVFTVCGENHEAYGSASPVEGFFAGKVACVWDNITNRHFYKDHALYAKTEGEFIENMVKAMSMKIDHAKTRQYAVDNFGVDQFVNNFMRATQVLGLKEE